MLCLHLKDDISVTDILKILKITWNYLHFFYQVSKNLKAFTVSRVSNDPQQLSLAPGLPPAKPGRACYDRPNPTRRGYFYQMSNMYTCIAYLTEIRKFWSKNLAKETRNQSIIFVRGILGAIFRFIIQQLLAVIGRQTQRYSAGGSSDAAFRCQYCSNTNINFNKTCCTRWFAVFAASRNILLALGCNHQSV